jgi:hypothetical protein
MYGSEYWAVNGSERKKNKGQECVLRRVSGHTFIYHMRYTAVPTGLKIYALEERIHGYNNEFTEELISYFPLIRHGPHRKRRVQ